MDESSDTTTQTRRDLGHAIDLELARIAQGPPSEEAERARAELVQRHDEVASTEAALATGCAPEEALRAAHRGLQQAVGAFDPDRGVDFATYAAARVRGAVRWCSAGSARTPLHGRHGRFLQVRTATSALHEELGRSPRLAEVADHLGYAPSEVLDGFALRSAARVLTAQLAARLAEDGSPTPDLTSAITELDERTRLVLYRLVCDGRSRREIATELGMSTFDVDELEQRGRRHLRRATSAD